jgi:hypothetical protein
MTKTRVLLVVLAIVAAAGTEWLFGSRVIAQTRSLPIF